MARIEAEIKEIGPETVAYIARKGPFSLMGEVMGELIGMMKSRGLEMAGPPFGIYYHAPGEVPEEELSWEVCFPVARESQGEGVKVMPARLVASTVHKGPYHTLEATYNALGAWIGAQGYQIAGPAEEVYLSNPQEIAPEELLTEVRFPVAESEEAPS